MSYNSPAHAPFSLAQSTQPTSAGKDKTELLATLRAAVSSAQAEINKELTTRVEDDKECQAAAAGSAESANEDEAEQNYGEEAQGED